MSEFPYHRVLPLSELAPGTMRCVEVGDVPVLLVHGRDGTLSAVHNICTHAYARMDEGRLRGNRVICPLHGASFDVRTGAVLGAPATVPLASYPVRVAGDHIEVQVFP
jgi:3-phenylpropionate/trans-cinnamate dioxygenase ferredoxin component